MIAQAAAAIFKAKLKIATEREGYVLGTLRRLVVDLLCKLLPEPPSPLRASL
jgi:hypothetical protein